MSTPLEQIIRDKIEAEGPIPLDEYMSLCLGHPEHGYYMTRDPFGKQGDFTTAPEISQMFGELIGAWIVDSWEKMGCPSPFILLECGPGRGTLMQDALRVTKAETRFHDALELHFLETSPILKEKQKQALEGFSATWHTDLDSLPNYAPVILIGNEFLDALSVTQLVKTETGWDEKYVEIDKNGSFRISVKTAENRKIDLIPPLLIQPKIGEQVEVSLEQKEFIEKFINIIEKQSGICLFIDYGFIHNVAGETLQAIKNHAYCNIFEADIQAALDRLIGIGNKRDEMGELFKVIAFSSDPTIQLAGF